MYHYNYIIPTRLDPTISPAFEGLTLKNLVEGSVVFSGVGGLIAQDNLNFFFDNTNNRLGILTNTPSESIETGGNIRMNTFTGGSALFTDTNGTISEDNPNFFWDDTNNRLGILTNTPNESIETGGNIRMNTFTGGSVLFTDTNGTISEDNANIFWDNTNDRLGIGTNVIPHGGIGGAKLAIEGTDSSASAGPHVQYTTATDDYPVFQSLNYAHDDVSLNFDAYNDGGWKSSDLGSNFQIRKNTDSLSFNYESGVAQGGTVVWDEAMSIGSDGEVALENITFNGPIILANPLTPPELTGNTDDYNPTGLSGTNILRISSGGNYSLTGLEAPASGAGQLILIVNVGSSNISIKNNDTGSLVANRFLAGADKTIQSDESVIIVYDGASARWRLTAQQL